MDEAERLSLAALGRTPGFQRTFVKAIELVKTTYRTGQSHVAFSCGKDSAVTLHLCQQVDQNVPALFCSTEQKNYLDNYDEIIQRWQSEFQANIKETMLTPYNWEPRRSIRQILNAPSNDVCFLGLRKAESKARRISLSKFGLSHEYATGGTRICPIANWTDQHVWAYIALHNLPYLSFYDSVPKFSAKGRTSVFLGTGHDGTALAVEARCYANAHSFHFKRWEEENPDVVRLMRCFWEIKSLDVTGKRALAFLESKGVPVPEQRLAMFDTMKAKNVATFTDAKGKFPYLSMAAWVLFKQIYGVVSNESFDDIVDQLRPQ